MAQASIQFRKRMFNQIYLNYPVNGVPTNLLTLYDTKTIVFYGGAGSGKSKFAVQRAVYKALKFPNRLCLVVRKVSSTLRDSIFAEFKSVLSQYKIIHLCDIKESYLTITLPNGSQFLFKGMDDPEKIKSISGLDDIIIEEATELSLQDYSQLCLRLRSLTCYNQMVLMYNPTSKNNWVYKTFHEGELPPSCLVVHTTYLDNKFLPQSYIDSLEDMKRTNPDYYTIYALGKFASLGKTVYTNYTIEEFNYMQIIKNGGRAYFGLDWGYTNDPTAFIACVVQEAEKKIYIFDEHYEKSMVNEEIADMIYLKGFAKEVITGDSSEPKSIEELRRRGIRRIKGARKGNDSIVHGIQFIQQYQLVIHPSCKNFIIEIENYAWRKNDSTGEYYNKPIDDYNHLMDAFRYAIEELIPRGKITSISKKLLGF